MEKCNQEGFSLVEVLTAILILSIGMLGVGTILITSLHNDGYVRRVQAAEFIAQNQMESLAAQMAKSKLSSSDSGTYSLPTDTTSADYFLDLSRIYSWSWTVTEETDLTKVFVVVGWPLGEASCTQSAPQNCRHTLRYTGYLIPKE